MKIETFYLYVGLILMFCLGIILGIFIQQAVIQATLMKVAMNMDGVEINVNFNETKMMDALYNNLEEDGFMDFKNESI